MTDIREKLEKIAGHGGRGAIATAAHQLGVSTRTLHRAIAEGPSERLAAEIEKELKRLTLTAKEVDKEELYEVRFDNSEEGFIKAIQIFDGEISRAKERHKGALTSRYFQVGYLMGQAFMARDIALQKDIDGYVKYFITKAASEIEKNQAAKRGL